MLKPTILLDKSYLQGSKVIDIQRACGKPSTHYEDTRFRFEEELASADYQMPPEAAETMEKEAEQLRHDVASLLSHVARFPR